MENGQGIAFSKTVHYSTNHLGACVTSARHKTSGLGRTERGLLSQELFSIKTSPHHEQMEKPHSGETPTIPCKRNKRRRGEAEHRSKCNRGLGSRERL